MKLPIFTVVALLAASTTVFADNGRTFFGDGSPENTYIAGQQNSRQVYNNDSIKYHVGHTNSKKAYHIGRTIFGDGSTENTHIAGQRTLRSTDNSSDINYYVGRTIFGDGSVENSYITGR